MAAVVSRALCEEVVPVNVASRSHRGIRVPPEHYEMLDGLAADFEGGVNDVLEGDVSSGAVGDVGGEDETGAARLNAVAERARAEAGEDDAVYCAYSDGGEHEHDGFRADGHVDGDAVAFLYAHSAERGCYALDFVLELSVGEDLAVAALVGIDEGCVAAPAAVDVVVDAVVGEVGLGAAEPAKFGRLPVEDFVPLAEPGEVFGGAFPEGYGVVSGFAAPPACDRVDCLHALSCLPTNSACVV